MTKSDIRSQVYKFIKDKNGKAVLWQSPNLPLWTWFIAMLLTHILPYGQWNFVASLISFGALFTWAYLEIRQGVNYFRRTVGVLVIIWMIKSRI